MSRIFILACSLIVVAACGDDGTQLPATEADAAIDAATIVDASPGAPPIDATPVVDANPNIPAAVTTACTHVCTSLGDCFGKTDPADLADLADCIEGCSEDLVDCSALEVTAVDTCSAETCGIDEKKDNPLLMCITGIACVDM